MIEHFLSFCGKTITAGLGYVEGRNRWGLRGACKAFNRAGNKGG